jgi:hypothetical protein
LRLNFCSTLCALFLNIRIAQRLFKPSSVWTLRALRAKLSAVGLTPRTFRTEGVVEGGRSIGKPVKAVGLALILTFWKHRSLLADRYFFRLFPRMPPPNPEIHRIPPNCKYFSPYPPPEFQPFICDVTRSFALCQFGVSLFVALSLYRLRQHYTTNTTYWIPNRRAVFAAEPSPSGLRSRAIPAPSLSHRRAVSAAEPSPRHR